MAFESAAPPYGAGRAAPELTTPMSALVWALESSLALARDEGVPLRSRLLHVRKQLVFLLENFLSDASLPDGPEGGP